MTWQAVICISAAALFIGAKLGTVCVNEWRRVQLESALDKLEEAEWKLEKSEREVRELREWLEECEKPDGYAGNGIYDEDGTRIGTYREKWCRIGMRMYLRKEDARETQA